MQIPNLQKEKFFGKKSVPYYFVSRPDVTEVRLKVCCLDDSCLTDCVILGHHGAGGVEVGRDLHVGRPGVVQLSFEVVNPPEENPAENRQENRGECEEGDDDGLYPVGEEVGDESGVVLTLPVLPGSLPGDWPPPQVIWLTGAGGEVEGEGLGAGLETGGAETGAGGAVPHPAPPLYTPPSLLLRPALTAAALSAPGVGRGLGPALLLQVVGTPALALHLVLHLQAGALLLTLPPRHRALGHHHRHLPHLPHSGHAGAGAVTAPAAPPHHHVARAQLLDVRVVRPRNWNHLKTKKVFET